jgi:hypothetical protein
MSLNGITSAQVQIHGGALSASEQWTCGGRA